MGCGDLGSDAGESIDSHAAAFSASASTDLVAVCDLDATRARACGERWRVPHWYSDPAEMLRDTRPELVSIATPDETHLSVLEVVLQAACVRGVLLEKPVGLNAADAFEAQRLAERSNTPIAVNYTRRYVPSHVSLRKTLRCGGLGEIQCVSGYYTKGTFHNGTHWFDLARFLFSDIVEVAAFPGAPGRPHDPSYDAHLSFDSGLRGSVMGCDAAAFSLFEMDIIGTHGRIRLVDSGFTIEVYAATPSDTHPGYTVLAPPTKSQPGFEDALLRVVEDLVDSIGAHRAPRCSLDDGVKAVVVAEAVAESVRTGRVVRIGQPA
jgi:predicted dehydrogenase